MSTTISRLAKTLNVKYMVARDLAWAAEVSIVRVDGVEFIARRDADAIVAAHAA